MSNQEHNEQPAAVSEDSGMWIDEPVESAHETPVVVERPKKSQLPADRHTRRRIERFWEEHALRAQMVDDVDAA